MNSHLAGGVHVTNLGDVSVAFVTLLISRTACFSVHVLKGQASKRKDGLNFSYEFINLR